MTEVSNKVVNKSCVFVLNQTALDSQLDDLTLIKEATLTESGEVKRTIRLLENAQRSYFITKKGYQTYKDKRENEPVERLDEFSSNQSGLVHALNRKLNYIGGERPRLSMLNRSPYVYGTDINITTIYNHKLNKEYSEKYEGEFLPRASAAMLDYETDVNKGHEGIIIGTLCIDKTIYLAATEEYTKGIENFDDHVIKHANENIAGMIEKNGFKLRVKVVKDEMAVVRAMMGLCHRFKPDFVCIWNMQFDVEKMLLACSRAGVDPADVFCDPAIPARYRRFKWKMGNAKRKKADGKEMNLDPTDLWHTVSCLASFQFVCSMATFRLIRSSEQLRNNYQLDGILKDFTEVEKYKWDGADHLKASSIEWHRFMQSELPSADNRIAYSVYAMVDTGSMKQLDDAIKDIQVALLPYLGISELARIKSNPKRLCDAYHCYLQDEHNRILCGTSDSMVEELDKEIMDRRDWIITLNNYTLDIPVVDLLVPGCEAFEKKAKIYRWVYDIDVTSSYPSNQVAANISRGTTVSETLHIEGLPESELRRNAVNMTNVPANSVDIAASLMGMPKLSELEAMFEEDMKK